HVDLLCYGLDQRRRGANDGVAVSISNHWIVPVAGRCDLGALVCGEGRSTRQRQRDEHAQAEPSFHDRGSFFLSGVGSAGRALSWRKKLGLAINYRPFSSAP